MQNPRSSCCDGGAARRGGSGGCGRISLLWRQLEVLIDISPWLPPLILRRRLTYPPYRPYPKAMRKASAAKIAAVPWRIGAIRIKELLQELVCAFACHRRYL